MLNLSNSFAALQFKHMSILLFYPDQATAEHYLQDQRFVYLDKDGWWILTEGKRICVNWKDLKIDFSIETSSVTKVLKEINTLGPTFSRWSSAGDQLELIKRELLIYILKIQNGLRKFNIEKVISFTGVSHHLENHAFELAAQEQRVKLIFLYQEPVGERLLPFVGSVINREKLNVNLSDTNYRELKFVILEVVQNLIYGETGRWGKKVFFLRI